MKIRKFEAEVDVLGAWCLVEWDGERLALHGVRDKGRVDRILKILEQETLVEEALASVTPLPPHDGGSKIETRLVEVPADLPTAEPSKAKAIVAEEAFRRSATFTELVRAMVEGGQWGPAGADAYVDAILAMPDLPLLKRALRPFDSILRGLLAAGVIKGAPEEIEREAERLRSIYAGRFDGTNRAAS
jgi:hypothetical protein